MPDPRLIAFDVTEAILKQVKALEELAKAEQPEAIAPLVGRQTEATGQIVTVWRNYQRALDPEGYAAALTELEQLQSLGLVKVDVPFLKGGLKT